MSIKKKRVSKRNKISWRKHVDITDVEEFLEDQRLEERLGERTENLTDQQLFQIDTKPQEKQLSSREKKKLAAKTLPRCFSLLQPLTKVPDPLIKRNRVRTKEERKHPIAKRNEEKRLLQGIVRERERQAAENREYDKKRKMEDKKNNKIGAFNNDLWEVEDVDPAKVVDPQWVTNDTLRHTRQGLGKLRKSVSKSLYRKPTILKSVELPHPGMSYNPSLKDHQALLQEVAKSEVEKIKEEKHIERVTTKMFKRITSDKKESSWLTEMSEGLPSKKNAKNTDTNDDDDDKEFKSINPPSLNKKKDKKQRRKEKEQKQLEKLRLDQKIEKKKVADIYKLRRLNQIIEKKEKQSETQKVKKIKKKEDLKSQPRNLSKNKFQNPDLEFHMGNEISGNLRGLKTEGNLLRDRFKSLQKRSILEPTVRQPPRRKAKFKKYERASHKMGWEPKGY